VSDGQRQGHRDLTAIAFKYQGHPEAKKAGGPKGLDYVLLNGATAVAAAAAATKVKKGTDAEGTVRRQSKGGDLDVASGLPDAEALMRQSSASSGPGNDVVAAMREAMGANVGGVRLHTDGAANQAAELLNARAFSVGSDVYFGSGQYAPGSKNGLELLFHELAHTTQPAERGTEAPGTGLTLGSASSSAEHAADHAAHGALSVMSGPQTASGPELASPTLAPMSDASTIRRQAKTGDPVKKKQSHAEKMTEQILHAVTLTETNGKAIPSRLHTSAGLRASYENKVQATAIRAVDHIGRHKNVMEDFDIDRKGLDDGITRMRAARRIWTSAMKRGSGGVEAFVKKHQKTLDAASLTSADVTQMMHMRDFKVSAYNPVVASRDYSATLSADDLWAKATDEEKARYGSKEALAGSEADMKSMRTTVAGRMQKTIHEILGRRAGLDDVSLRTYRTRQRSGRPIWGEDRAAWERKALEGGGDEIGKKVQEATEHDGGLTLGREVIATHVRSLLKANPKTTAYQLVRAVAAQHNPWAGDVYINKTWKHYKNTYGG
jgi:hypothetical protein